MIDFFTYLAGQVIQPSTEIYPAIAAQYAPGPDVPGAALAPEPPALDSTLQPVPATVTDRIYAGQKGQPPIDHPAFPRTIDAKTRTPAPAITNIQKLQTLPNLEKNAHATVEESASPFTAGTLGSADQAEKPIASQIGSAADGNEASRAPGESAEGQHTGRLILPVIEPPRLNALLADEVVSPSAPADQALPEKAESYPTTSEPDIGGQVPKTVQRAVPNIGPETLPLVKPFSTVEAIRISFAPAGSSFPTRDGHDLTQTTPLAKDNNSAQMPLYVPQEPVDSPVSQASPETRSVEGSTAIAALPRLASPEPALPAGESLFPTPEVHESPRPGKLAASLRNMSKAQDQGVQSETKSLHLEAQSPRSTAFNPSSILRPVIAAQPVPSGKTNSSEAEKNSNASIQSARSSPDLEAGDPPEAGGKARSRSIISRRDSNIPDAHIPLLLNFRPEADTPAQSRSQTFPSRSTNRLPLGDAILPSLLMVVAALYPEEEPRRSHPVQTTPINEAATAAPRLQPDHADERGSQAERGVLVTEDAHQAMSPGKTVHLPPLASLLNPYSSIRPAIAAESPLVEKTDNSRTESAQTTVPTLHLTIGRIVVRAVPPISPASSPSVSARRQPSISLSDYLARHGGH